MLPQGNQDGIDQVYNKYSAFVLTKYFDADATQWYMIEMYERLLRDNLKWYHKYYENKIGFQDYLMGKYFTVAMLEKMSLNARIEDSKQVDPETGKIIVDAYLTSRLDIVNKEIVIAEEIFKNHMAFEPDENLRYYMYPGHELILYATAKEQYIPSEPDRNVGLLVEYQYVEAHGTSEGGPLEGIIYKNNGDIYPQLEFWRSFISYQDQDKNIDVLCPTSDWMKQIYNDYGGTVSLNDIFFSENYANIKKPEGLDDNWLLVADPENTHPLKYVKKVGAGDEIETPTVSLKGETQYTPIYYYHNNKNEPASTKFVGLAVMGKPDPSYKESIIIYTNEDSAPASQSVQIDYDTNKSELPSHSVMTISPTNVSDYMDMKIHKLDVTTSSNQELLANFYAAQKGKKANVVASYGVFSRRSLSKEEDGSARILACFNLAYKTPGVIYAVCYNQTIGAYLLSGTVDKDGMAVFNNYLLKEASNVTLFTMK